MKKTTAILVALQLCLVMGGRGLADQPAGELDFETCKDNQAIDAFLCQASPLYAAMARLAEFHGGYRIEEKADVKAGCWFPGTRTIAVNPELQGAGRVTIVAFEMTNVYQQRSHGDVDRAARVGIITTESEFALRHELVEYDGLRLHREILQEVETHLGKLPPAFFFISTEKPATVAEYRLPLVMDHITEMESSGHGDIYKTWFRANALKETRK